MRTFDLKKKIVRPSSPSHSQHAKFQAFLRLLAEKRYWLKMKWSSVFLAVFLLVVGQVFWQSHQVGLAQTYEVQSSVQQIRSQSLVRFTQLPVKKYDPKLDMLVSYLAEKKSPLVSYAGILARMPSWKLLLGIAHAETNLCKKTDRNNCWGIGPGTPFSYEDIAQGLYYANYLIEKYRTKGLENPEALVQTYVGHYSANWVTAVRDVFYELEQRGLQ